MNMTSFLLVDEQKHFLFSGLNEILVFFSSMSLKSYQVIDFCNFIGKKV